MAAKHSTSKFLARILFLLLLGLAATVFGTLAAHAYSGQDPAPSAPVVRLLSEASADLTAGHQGG